MYKMALQSQENEATVTLRVIEEHKMRTEGHERAYEQHWQARARAFEAEAYGQHEYAE